MVIVARAGGTAVLHVEAAAAVAGDRAEAPGVEHGSIRADEEAADGAVEARGIAVAIPIAPGAEALAPHRQSVRGRRNCARSPVRIGHDVAARCTHASEGGAD